MFKRLVLGLPGLLAVVLLVISLLSCIAPPVMPEPTAVPLLSSPSAVPTATETPVDTFADVRAAMVRNQIEARGVKDAAVLAVMRRVPRHRFVPDEYISAAYEDHPLPIGHGQTISQPYIVALMTQSLRIKPGDKVLEIGTGSGYQAAILAELGAETYTVEIIPELARQAEARLRELGYSEIQVLNADGYYGWQDHAPYDAIIVTCAPDHLPQPLVSQLRDGGRLVIPIGPQGAFQTLWLFEKHGEELTSTNLGDVVFVPLTGGH